MSRRIAFLIIIATFALALACTRERQNSASTSSNFVLPYAVNINTASPAELQKIPHIGEILAAKIVAYRETHGPFRRVEHLMLIDGISDKRFRKIRPLVRIE